MRIKTDHSKIKQVRKIKKNSSGFNRVWIMWHRDPKVHSGQ